MSRFAATFATLVSVFSVAALGVAPAEAASDAFLSDGAWESAKNGVGPVERDGANGSRAPHDGGPLALQGHTYAKGLGVHAPSDVRYRLGAGCTRFSAVVGVDDEVGARGSVVFEVFVDDVQAFRSKRLTGSSRPKAVAVKLSKRSVVLRLVVRASGDGSAGDHADWANARVHCLAGSFGVSRWYGPTSAFNQPIPQDAAVAPTSQAMVDALINSVKGREGLTVAAGAWTVPMYIATPSTPRYDVVVTSSWARGRTLFSVPVPDDARPDPAGDRHMAVLDPARGCEYDFWLAKRTGSGWTAGGVARLGLKGRGVTTNGARAAGFGLGAGLIRPEELAIGIIDHALVFAYPTVRKGMIVAPATGGSGPSRAEGAIPYGARVQLDPTLDLDSLGLNTWQRTIADALQHYGMILGDVGGTLSLYAEHNSTASVPYPWGEATFAFLPERLVRHFRVLELGPRVKPNYAVVPNRCGKFNW